MYACRGVYPSLRPWSKIPPCRWSLPSLYLPPVSPLPCPFPLHFLLRYEPFSPLPSPPCPCKQGSGVSLWENFLKSRWLWVKFDSLLGKIWPLNRRTISGADSLKIGIFETRPIWLRWVSGDEQWRLMIIAGKSQDNVHMADFFSKLFLVTVQ